MRAGILESKRTGMNPAGKALWYLESHFGQTRPQLDAIFHAVDRQKKCQIIEGFYPPGV